MKKRRFISLVGSGGRRYDLCIFSIFQDGLILFDYQLFFELNAHSGNWQCVRGINADSPDYPFDGMDVLMSAIGIEIMRCEDHYSLFLQPDRLYYERLKGFLPDGVLIPGNDVPVPNRPVD